MTEVITEPCELCGKVLPVDEMAFETLQVNDCFKVWICGECFSAL
jgi:uncharacterized protein YlaI